MSGPCAVIPTHNHVDALDAILTRLEVEKLPAIVVDDGSDPPVGARIAEICARHPGTEVQRHAFNEGKGFAVMCGIARAGERGFTHAVQIDADGQHDLDGLKPLLAEAALNPDAIVTGVPQYDRTMPLLRRIWRPFTNFWVHVNTLSWHIKDAMCGFRVYPVDATLALVTRSVHVRRMDFDVEILVKAYWAGIAVAAVPVRVSYPQGNFSNFKLVRDNVMLSRMQTRLFLGMLLRSPYLLFRRRPQLRKPGGQPTPWASMTERGAYWGMRILAGVYAVLGRTICLGAMVPIVAYFYVTGREQRQASRDYLDRMWKRGMFPHQPTHWTSFRHFMSFAASALDKLAAWTGKIPQAELKGVTSGLLREVELSRKGAFIITAHLGNPEVIRAVSVLGNHVRVNVLMHTEHAQLFNRLIKEFSPDSPVRAFAVTKVGVDTAMVLSQAVERGEWVVIVGDRVPVVERGRIVEVPFLGELAAFPQGPYILGALLKAPSYLMFCVRGHKGFDVHFSKFADPIELPRADRIGAIRRYASLYAKELEARVAETPLQWFNFYSFWGAAREARTEASAVQRVV